MVKDKFANILHLDTEKTWRGGEQQLLYLVQGLRNDGYNNFIATSPNSVLAKRLKEQKFSVIEIKNWGEADIFSALKLCSIIKNENIDIVHAHTAHTASLGALIKRGHVLTFDKKLLVSKSKCQMSSRNPLTLTKLIVSRRVDFHLKKNMFSRWKYEQADKIAAISQGVKKVLISDGIPEKNIKVVPSGIDLNRFKNIDGKYIYDELRIDPNISLVGIVAALVPHKDHKNFLHAAKRVKENFSKVKFLVVGEGLLKEELEQLTKELNLEEDVIFTGFRKDVLEIISILNVFVLSSYLEGLGTALLDALALNKPVVATAVGGIPEIVKNNETGILVPARDSKKLAQGIIKLIEDKILANELAENGKIHVQNFDVRKMVEKTEQIYQEVMQVSA